MYTGTNNYGDNNDGKNPERSGSVRGEEASENAQLNGYGLGQSGHLECGVGHFSVRANRANCAWLDQLRSTDRSPGGIVSRLLDEKINRLGEVRGRLEIVNRRKVEYETKIVELEREIEEIRGIATEIQQMELVDADDG